MKLFDKHRLFVDCVDESLINLVLLLSIAFLRLFIKAEIKIARATLLKFEGANRNHKLFHKLAEGIIGSSRTFENEERLIALEIYDLLEINLL